MINNHLVSFIERWERLDEEKRGLQELLRDLKAEAKAFGFDVKMIGRMVAERRMSPDQRREEQALAEVYRAGCGLLDGTPLGDAARRRLMGEPPATEAAAEPAEAAERNEAANGAGVEEAHAEGAKAQRAGVRIIDNPYVAGDPRRAAWDEGFCSASGSDGMDIPEAWRRKPKKAATEKPAAEKAAAEPAEQAADPDQQDLPMGDAADARPQDGAEDAAEAPAKRAAATRKPRAPAKKSAKKPAEPGRGKRRRAGDDGEAHP